jgi:hypothetical protein
MNIEILLVVLLTFFAAGIFVFLLLTLKAVQNVKKEIRDIAIILIRPNSNRLSIKDITAADLDFYYSDEQNRVAQPKDTKLEKLYELDEQNRAAIKERREQFTEQYKTDPYKAMRDLLLEFLFHPDWNGKSIYDPAVMGQLIDLEAAFNGKKPDTGGTEKGGKT